MKNLFIFLSLVLSISATANTIDYSLQDSLQEGKVEAAYLDMLSVKLTNADLAFETKASNLPEPLDVVEGKIIAAMINMIEGEIEKAYALYRALENADSIDDASTKKLRDQISLINRLVIEL
ncbi:MAG: hypothetical protein ACJAT2_001181 [Bacteriovoracaceae bacterium]|jgi:hypothetical protein